MVRLAIAAWIIPILFAVGLGAQKPLKRPYHRVPLEKVAQSGRTHVETCGLVVYRRRMADGDWHVTLERGGVKLVLEIIPGLPLDVPRKGQTITARGITRIDRGHGWAELHPLEWWEAVVRCPR